MQEHHKYEVPRQWAAFGPAPRLIPAALRWRSLFPAEPHIISHLRGLHIFTVEMLASCGEEACPDRHGRARVCDAAQQLIDASEKAAPFHWSTPRCVSATTDCQLEGTGGAACRQHAKAFPHHRRRRS